MPVELVYLAGLIFLIVLLAAALVIFWRLLRSWRRGRTVDAWRSALSQLGRSPLAREAVAKLSLLIERRLEDAVQDVVLDVVPGLRNGNKPPPLPVLLPPVAPPAVSPPAPAPAPATPPEKSIYNGPIAPAAEVLSLMRQLQETYLQQKQADQAWFTSLLQQNLGSSRQTEVESLKKDVATLKQTLGKLSGTMQVQIDPSQLKPSQ